jgi:hypothetical protein
MACEWKAGGCVHCLHIREDGNVVCCHCGKVWYKEQFYPYTIPPSDTGNLPWLPDAWYCSGTIC